MGKIFKKELNEDNKGEGIPKRPGNIKNADQKPFQAIKEEHLKLLKK